MHHLLSREQPWHAAATLSVLVRPMLQGPARAGAQRPRDALSSLHPHTRTPQAALKMGGGLALCAIFSDPLVEALSNLSK